MEDKLGSTAARTAGVIPQHSSSGSPFPARFGLLVFPLPTLATTPHQLPIKEAWVLGLFSLLHIKSCNSLHADEVLAHNAHPPHTHLSLNCKTYFFSCMFKFAGFKNSGSCRRYSTCLTKKIHHVAHLELCCYNCCWKELHNWKHNSYSLLSKTQRMQSSLQNVSVSMYLASLW